jgi:catechol 2,3-dioxygenase-like lactoylglutathione lyase family enzyme
MRLHHVQVVCPPGGEDDARRFYVVGLGLTEVAKPEALAHRGGAWFRAFGTSGEVTTEIHVGVEAPFVPARKAHPAILLDGAADLERLATRLESAGFAVDWSERLSFDGWQRFHTADAHGNRVEVLAPLA